MSSIDGSPNMKLKLTKEPVAQIAFAICPPEPLGSLKGATGPEGESRARTCERIRGMPRAPSKFGPAARRRFLDHLRETGHLGPRPLSCPQANG